MEMNYIKEFVVLAEVGNFSEAAEHLFISQSSLSKHIKSIERELGVPLFNRSTRKVKLNEFGQVFLPYARQITNIQNEYTEAFFNKLENTKKSITIGSIPSMAQYNITDVLAEFKRNNNNITLNVIQAESDKLEDMLYENICDIAFIREVNDVNNLFTKLPYTSDTLVAIFPINHPFAKYKTISLEQLKSENFLLLPQDTILHNICKTSCKHKGFDPNIIFTDHRVENIIDLVVKGMGISLLSKKLAIYLFNPNISIVDISPSIYSHISLCYKKNTKLSVITNLFLSYIKLL
ncbi:LysR family transcriptional regulator [Clostridium sp. SHJSY1]|uniref:LysR family transcriptional regulator n=1 Tax=Clostridium sp. SHJSY1 TaxID=2942483 RepID=UPI0028743164|nr:LysR family transcriptional regulator [Clostridium sp. SHJSY1]MDS0525554.1 LysR family transcriptional regulator [Clostridium sp. SHJSY1]